MLLALLILSCGRSEQAAPAADVAPVVAPGVLRIVRLTTTTTAAPFRWDNELRGLTTTALTLGLHDLRGVVVLTDPLGVAWQSPPPTAEETWTGAAQLTATGSELSLALTLCREAACETHTATGTREAPWSMFATALEGAAGQLGEVVTPEIRAAWQSPGSKDSYAELITGRGCATMYGLLPPPVDPTDKRENPVLRAIFIDPKQPIAQWMWARFQLEHLGPEQSPDKAVEAFRRAAQARPSSALLNADLAASLALAGKTAEAALVWQGLHDADRTDPRWVEPLARALVENGEPLLASAVLARANAGAEKSPSIAELRVRIAEALGKDDLDPLLARWQAVDGASPVPVRRRIADRVSRGAYADALTLVNPLRARAPGPETDALEVALYTATNQLDAAADRAPDAVASKLRARAAVESDPATVVEVTDATTALAAAEATLWAGQPGRSLDAAAFALAAGVGSEGWVARAKALEASGRGAESVAAWQEAWLLDPAAEGGPVSGARIASTFRIAEPEAPIEPAGEPAGLNMGLEEL